MAIDTFPIVTLADLQAPGRTGYYVSWVPRYEVPWGLPQVGQVAMPPPRFYSGGGPVMHLAPQILGKFCYVHN